MLTKFELILPLILIVLISLPLIPVFQGKKSVKTAKFRLGLHTAMFFGIIAVVLFVQMSQTKTLAAEEAGAVSGLVGSSAQGMGFLAAALATGLSGIGSGIAVAAAAPAAIGAFSENEKNFGKSLIIVVLGEGIAIYGLLISILIIMLKL